MDKYKKQKDLERISVVANVKGVPIGCKAVRRRGTYVEGPGRLGGVENV